MKNKCVGLDCEMCGNTKCPDEEKEKIINGIDVSECAYFNSVTYEEPYCNIDQEHLYTCSSDENCYYKQFKRLQKENEELKKYQYTQEYLQSEIEKRQKALEEIREMLKKSMSLKSNAYNHFINVEKAIDKINEVLNDRD